MKHTGTLSWAVACLACLGMIVPVAPLQSAEPDPGTNQQVNWAVDVELQSGGVLVGQALAASGLPLPSTRVSVRQGGREVLATTTDQQGVFRAAGLRSGVYEIVAGEAHGVYRLWAAGSAPPTAQAGVLVVAAGAVRGQEGPIGYWLGNPWILGAVVATAVAIPIAIRQHRLDRESSP